MLHSGENGATSQHCALAECCSALMEEEVFITLKLLHLRLNMPPAPKCSKGTGKPEEAQWRALILVRARVLALEERLRDWDFFSLGKRCSREAQQQIPSTHHGGEQLSGWQSWAVHGRNWNKRFRLDIRKHFLALRTVRPGGSGCPEKLCTLSLEVFKTWHEILNKLVWAYSWACSEQEGLVWDLQSFPSPWMVILSAGVSGTPETRN